MNTDAERGLQVAPSGAFGLVQAASSFGHRSGLKTAPLFESVSIRVHPWLKSFCIDASTSFTFHPAPRSAESFTAPARTGGTARHRSAAARTRPRTAGQTGVRSHARHSHQPAHGQAPGRSGNRPRLAA